MNARTIFGAHLALAAGITGLVLASAPTAHAVTPHLASVTPAPASVRKPTPVPLPYSVNRPCNYEDGVNCYWNAGTSGNGKGHSFIVRKIGKLTCVIYVNKGDGHLDNCSK